MASDAPLAIGTELRRLRTERRLSLRHVADLVDVHHTRIGEWERGFDAHSGRPVLPPFDAVRRLARVYGVPADGLLRLAGYGPEPQLPADEQALLGLYRGLGPDAREDLLRELQERFGAPEPQAEA